MASVNDVLLKPTAFLNIIIAGSRAHSADCRSRRRPSRSVERCNSHHNQTRQQPDVSVLGQSADRRGDMGQAGTPTTRHYEMHIILDYTIHFIWYSVAPCVQDGDGKILSPAQSATSGFMAACIGPILNNPFDVVKVGRYACIQQWYLD